MNSTWRFNCFWSHISLIWVLGLSGLLASSSSAAPTNQILAGAAKVDITPTAPVRLGGYAARTAPFKSIAQRIHVKALAIRDLKENLTLILCADTIGVPGWFNRELSSRIQSELGIPRERLLFACSHSHSTPAIKGALENAYGLNSEASAAVEAYTREFLDRSVQCARQAITNLQPAVLAFGRGEANFAINRRQFTKSGVVIGTNPDGKTDRDVPVMRVTAADESVRAVVFGYACHCTTLGPTDEVSGDWAGYAQAELEEAYPGAVALFITGCGADANPYPRGKTVHVAQHGLALAGAVAAVLNRPMTPLTGELRAAYDNAVLPLAPIPPKDHFASMLSNSVPANVRHAQLFLGMMDSGASMPTNYPCPVQVIRFGADLTLVAIGGEVVSDYSFRLQRELKNERLWTAGYCNDVFAYVPSLRILHEGGYEADNSMIYYGFPTRFAPEVEETLVKKVLELAAKTKASNQ